MDIKKKLEENLIPGMFMATAFAMILTELTGVIATISDGLITSRALGPDAYSAISLLGPFTGILLVIAGSMATGCQVIAAQYLGKGEKHLFRHRRGRDLRAAALLQSGKFFQKADNVLLDIVPCRIEEHRSLNSGVETVAKAIGSVVKGRPFLRNITREDWSLALKAVITAVSAHKSVYGGVDPEPGSMTRIYERLKVVPGGTSLHKAV